MPSVRNVGDEVLKRLKLNDEVIMISFISELIHQNADLAFVSHVVDHIKYVGDLIGFYHVGVESDFDEMLKSVVGLKDVSKFPTLVASLLARGISENDVKKVVSLNLIRVLREVKEVARRMFEEEQCMEERIHQLWSDDIRAFARSFYSHAEGCIAWCWSICSRSKVTTKEFNFSRNVTQAGISWSKQAQSALCYTVEALSQVCIKSTSWELHVLRGMNYREPSNLPFLRKQNGYDHAILTLTSKECWRIWRIMKAHDHLHAVAFGCTTEDHFQQGFIRVQKSAFPSLQSKCLWAYMLSIE